MRDKMGMQVQAALWLPQNATVGWGILKDNGDLTLVSGREGGKQNLLYHSPCANGSI